MLVALPALGYIFRNEVLEFVRKFDDPATLLALNTFEPGSAAALAAQALAVGARLILITAPLGFLVWAIRFLIRFNMRSQLLMDDASQRRTMLETYFTLVERGLVEPKADRAVLLEALFRALPGHGAEAPEPMNFADIAQLADPKSISNKN